MLPRLHEFDVVSMSPELAASHPGYTKLWSSAKFNDRVKIIIIDEGHCITTWGKSFRPAYLDVGKLKFLFPPETTRFYITSATMPKKVLQEVQEIVGIRKSNFEFIQRSNNRPNIHYATYWLRYPMNSLLDLVVVTRTQKKKLVFFQSKREAEKATLIVRSMLSDNSAKEKVLWFHSSMPAEWRDQAVERFNKGEIRTLMTTVILEMGIDFDGVEEVFIYRAPTGPDGFCKMFQQFGRAGRDGKTPVLAVLMMEKTYSDAAKREGTKKRKLATTSTQEPVAALMEIDVQSSPTTVVPMLPTPVTPVRRPLQDRTNVQPAVATASHVQGRGEQAIATSQPTPSTSRKRKAKDKGLGDNQIIPEIMDFANSGEASRPHCKRNPTVEEYFGNVGLQDTDPCPPECQRCVYSKQPSVPCCDSCNPDHSLFAILAPRPDDPPKVSRNPNKTKVPSSAEYVKTDVDNRLRTELTELVRIKAKETFGEDNDLYGPNHIMRRPVLERIVDLTRISVVLTIDNLSRETGWPPIFVKQFGSDVLAVCDQHRPQDPLATDSPAPTSPAMTPPVSLPPYPTMRTTAFPSALPTTPQPRKRAPPRCGNCGQVGHMKNNLKCPQRIVPLPNPSPPPSPQPSPIQVTNENAPLPHSTPITPRSQLLPGQLYAVPLDYRRLEYPPSPLPSTSLNSNIPHSPYTPLRPSRLATSTVPTDFASSMDTD